MKPGPTGNFPRGKFSADDEGGIAIGIAHRDRTVIVNFGKPVAWIGFSADDAIGLAEMLIEHARACGSTKPLSINIGGKREA